MILGSVLQPLLVRFLFITKSVFFCVTGNRIWMLDIEYRATEILMPPIFTVLTGDFMSSRHVSSEQYNTIVHKLE